MFAPFIRKQNEAMLDLREIKYGSGKQEIKYGSGKQGHAVNSQGLGVRMAMFSTFRCTREILATPPSHQVSAFQMPFTNLDAHRWLAEGWKKIYCFL